MFCRPILPTFSTPFKSFLPSLSLIPLLPPPIFPFFQLQKGGSTTTMQPCISDPDDLTSTSPETNNSTSSCSEATTMTNTSRMSTLTTTPYYSSKPHHPPPCHDLCWDKIQNPKSSTLTVEDLQFVHRLGRGDIGSVYLVELKGGNGCLFAAKVMDNNELVSRNKENRARVEREILEILDHPFLPTLYATLDSPRWSCLLTEFCPGGDLHVLRQRQPDKRFNEAAVRFYASEVVVALEYLHMMGIIYRDLKPENVLVRSDGHIMLTDFDLSLKDDTSTSTALIVFDQNPSPNNPSTDPPSATSSCIVPHCMIPTVASCFLKKRGRKERRGQRGSLKIVAEPIDVRSTSFVGTHEYLAPEIVLGDGHGNAVDWWTLGVFIFEMLYGTTPFEGLEHGLTLTNIVARALEFPKEPSVPGSVKDLVTQLLIKDPARRMGSTMGATAIKHHPYFDGVNWALLRCASPPYVPSARPGRDFISAVDWEDDSVEYY